MDRVSAATVLAIRGLCVTYASGAAAVRDLDLDIPDGMVVALVGESGCGKTTIGRAVLGLLPADAEVEGSILLGGRELVGLGERALRRVRGRDVGYVAQDPYAAMDPIRSVRRNVAVAWRAHRRRVGNAELADRVAALGVPDAAGRLRARPHQWSGGMLQRAGIVAGTALRPALVVADEPTSALDAELADTTLAALLATGAAVLLITHDLSLAARHADEVAVCYAGRVVERGPAAVVMAAPRHPYAEALLAATPRRRGELPRPLAGSPPDLRRLGPGCAFAARCDRAVPICRTERPALEDGVACHVVHGAGSDR